MTNEELLQALKELLEDAEEYHGEYSWLFEDRFGEKVGDVSDSMKNAKRILQESGVLKA